MPVPPVWRWSSLTTVDPTRKQCRLQFVDTPARLIGRPGAASRCSTRRSTTRRWPWSASRPAEHGGPSKWPPSTPKPATSSAGRSAVSRPSSTCAPTCCWRPSPRCRRRASSPAHSPNRPPSRVADLALAQAYCSDAFVFVAATSIQVHGGIGFTWEHPAHLYLRRARSDAQLLGGASWHRERYLQQIGA